MTDLLECRGVLIPQDERFINEKVRRKLDQDMYETAEVLGLPKFIRPGDRVLELGAGIGFVSCFMIKKLEVEHVTCIEANPALCDYIKTMHETNGIQNASVENAVAVSDCAPWPPNGMMPFYLTQPFWSSSLIEPQRRESTLTHVPAIRLSDVIARVKPTVIVCDIEGGEEALFGDVDLTGVRAVYMELHTRVYGGAGVRKVFDDMHRHDFYYHQKASCADVVLFERIKSSKPH